MHIQYMADAELIASGVTQLNTFFNNGEWPETLALGKVVADTNRDRHDRASAAFRIIEDIETVRWLSINPEDAQEAHELAEHFREIRIRLRRL